MPDASAAKKLTLKQKKLRCLKAAGHKRTARARRHARRRCRRKYAARRPSSRAPVAPPAAAPVTRPEQPPAPVLSRYVSVTAREFYLTLSRPLVGAGVVTIELRNYGEDPHDLAVSPTGSTQQLAAWSELGPGGVEPKRVTLSAGSYKLFCTIEGHEQVGMKATLQVQG
jgi:hypothetical protein